MKTKFTETHSVFTKSGTQLLKSDLEL